MTATESAVRQAKPRKRKRKWLRRLVILLILLAVLAGGGWIAYQRLRAEYRVTYDGYTATRGTISNSLSYTGSVQLKDSKSYTAPASAKVREVYVAVGDEVKEGDKLVRLSTGETLTADFDGRINKVDVAKGDEVSPNASLVQLVDFNHMQVSFRIGESDISEVSVGQSCRVTVSSAGSVFQSEISSIDYASYSGNNVAYYNATVDVDTSGSGSVYPGMQASITIPQEEATDVVVLKLDAVSTARDNTAFVYKQGEDGEMTQTPITVGVSNGNYVEVKEGVAEGETVYAIAKAEETLSGFAALMSQGFGSQQINMPSGMGSGRGNWGGGQPSNFPGGNSGSGGNGGNGSRRGN